ncbi:Hypothetical protein SRM_p61048 (plasmid) [Salinibacter ruber M8]|uniref:Uncharacterized protein n=1 Tax=Salinibacter ruber (strain M8) TaxID=761659 RepID=D5H4G4_SALRM|nr:Hypothetical protein SRM_p61048 [Salinibacter ruber M8]
MLDSTHCRSHFYTCRGMKACDCPLYRGSSIQLRRLTLAAFSLPVDGSIFHCVGLRNGTLMRLRFFTGPTESIRCRLPRL